MSPNEGRIHELALGKWQVKTEGMQKYSYPSGPVLWGQARYLRMPDGIYS